MVQKNKIMAEGKRKANVINVNNWGIWVKYVYTYIYVHIHIFTFHI